jgi:hypothetical protein
MSIKAKPYNHNFKFFKGTLAIKRRKIAIKNIMRLILKSSIDKARRLTVNTIKSLEMALIERKGEFSGK